MRRVLILRPEPGASVTLRRARERGLDAFATPLFEIEAVPWEAPDPNGFDGLLLTSANAVRHGGDQLNELRRLPAYAVGNATAAAARDAGFDIASTGDDGVERLLGSIQAGLKLLHIAGEDRKDVYCAGQEIRSITVYRSRPRNDVELCGAEGSIALIHSPRAGRRFAEKLEASDFDKQSVIIAAISCEAADAAGDGWASVETADARSDEALLALAERLCNNTPAK
jgi:uroporphyrinogen-III synthase